MEEDKNLKELLSEWALLDTPEDFTARVMQRVAAAHATTPLLKDKLMKVLVGVFVLVCLVLLALCIISQPVQLPFNFTVPLPPAYFSQITSFLIVFWVVMIGNEIVNRRRMQVV